MNPFDWIVIGVVIFIGTRVIWWLVVEVPTGHAKDEAICEKCWGKTLSNDVTEPLEWCDCPQRENSDKHEES